MNWKIALVVSALATAGGAFAALGCGGDECTRADDRFAECAASVAGNSSSSSSGELGTAEDCSQGRLCHSQCINTFTCQQINGNDPEYLECMTHCNVE